MPHWLASLSSSFPVDSILLPFYLPVVASPVAQTVKRLPALQETWVQSLGQEDLLEKEMAIHSSILPGKSHEHRSLVGYNPWGHKEVDMA